MVSWAITGATRGIGFEFVNNLSGDPNNQVFALIRSRGTAGPLEELATRRRNIHIIVTDLSDPKRLTQSAAEVSQVTAGSLDVLILNASSAGPETSALLPSAFHGKEEALEKEIIENVKTNVISNIFVINSFLDLVRHGKEKKIICISSQSGDIEFTRLSGFPTLIGYSAAKAGMMVVTTKFGVELAQHGIKTLSMSPGWVNTEAAQAVTGDPEVRKFVLGLFHKLDPNVTGPAPVDEAVINMLQVIQSLTEDDSGKFLTHHGKNVFGDSGKNVDWF
ncbi:hypothetical protein BKA65DRAFT_49551 [Rhexocercosporidium sp. MPI-PUGE-AT-0058]|nr:hypothetical protein BKA65DRAFT_49551 [Rhexocercosporidium sp. MPI-PUGE-AT-0058]